MVFGLNCGGSFAPEGSWRSRPVLVRADRCTLIVLGPFGFRAGRWCSGVLLRGYRAIERLYAAIFIGTSEPQPKLGNCGFRFLGPGSFQRGALWVPHLL